MKSKDEETVFWNEAGMDGWMAACLQQIQKSVNKITLVPPNSYDFMSIKHLCNAPMTDRLGIYMYLAFCRGISHSEWSKCQQIAFNFT